MENHLRKVDLFLTSMSALGVWLVTYTTIGALLPIYGRIGLSIAMALTGAIAYRLTVKEMDE